MGYVLAAMLWINGLLCGLIVGYQVGVERAADARRPVREDREIDRGPFPTGWVVPGEPVPPVRPGKPLGESRK